MPDRSKSLSEEEEMEISQGWDTKPPSRCCRPKLKKRYLIIIGILLLAGIAVMVVQLAFPYRSFGHEQLVPPDPDVALPPSPSVEHTFARGAVCSDGPPCSTVGRDILARNGSVVDAAVATMLCNGIVNCQSMGLGGGFLMTLYVRDSRTAITLNARETAPHLATSTMYRHNANLSTSGALAVAVPGELKGYWEAHKRYGWLPWSEVVAPSIKICEEGYNMTKHQSDSLTFNPENIYNDPTLRKQFVDPKTDKLYKYGTLIKPQKICQTLKLISEKGGDELYTGTLGKMLSADIRRTGGIITEDDLKNYRVRWDDPVEVELNDEVLYSVPPPGSGVLLGFILNILKGYHFTADSVSNINNTILTYHRIIEAYKYAFALRTELGDPDFVNITNLISNLTSEDYADAIRHQIVDNRTYNEPGSYGAVLFSQEDHGTAHISIIGPNGDAVSITSTINLYFGAGITSESTGIILNSGMDDFSSPVFENYFGLPGSPANAIAPGKRPLSSMCPSVIVNRDGDVRLVIGASGGTKILTATAYVIVRHLWFGESIKEAVDASRFHHQLYPMKITYEYGILDQVVKGLERLGHTTSRYRDRGSIICAVAKMGNLIYANADYRKGGDVFGLD